MVSKMVKMKCLGVGKPILSKPDIVSLGMLEMRHVEMPGLEDRGRNNVSFNEMFCSRMVHCHCPRWNLRIYVSLYQFHGAISSIKRPFVHVNLQASIHRSPPISQSLFWTRTLNGCKIIMNKIALLLYN
jgi:hypothetical protein